MADIELFEEPMIGRVKVGYYTDTVHDFLWCVENDLAIWYYSSTFETWFKEEEIEFENI